MLTPTARVAIDRVWDAFWSGGISNPIEVIDQFSYLLFVRRLDDLQIAMESRSKAVGEAIQDPVYPEGNAPTGVPYAHLRWSYFKDRSPVEAYELVANHVFPSLQHIANGRSAYAAHLHGARLTIPTPGLLAKVLDLLTDIPVNRRDASGDLYEYMLGKIASAGQNGQFRTPRHLVELIVELVQPTPSDEICDPACGTAGFLVASSEYVRKKHPDAMSNAARRDHFHASMFHGYDFDQTMLRIGSMNMLMHGVEQPDIRYRDSLSEPANGDAGKYSLVLANPPFAGSVDNDTVAPELLGVVRTRKTELLFLALSLRLLSPGGRAAVIVPDGVLFGSSRAHQDLRRTLVEDHRLDAVIKLPAGAFRPYTGVSTSILFFAKTESTSSDDIWFYDLRADGLSLNDRRKPLLDASKLGVVPDEPLTQAEHAKNNLPDVLDRWKKRHGAEKARSRSDQSFTVPKGEIAANNYMLALSAYHGSAIEDPDAERTQLDEVAELPSKVAFAGHQLIGHQNLSPLGVLIDRGADIDDERKSPARVTPLQVGDILCRTVGDPRWTLVTEAATRRLVAADQSVHVIRPKRVDPATLLALLRSESVEQEFQRFRYSGVGMPRISAKDLFRVTVPMFPSASRLAASDVEAVARLRQSMDRIYEELDRRSRQAFSGRTTDEGVGEFSNIAAEARTINDFVDTWLSPSARARSTMPYPLARTLRNLEIATALEDERAKNDAILHVFEAAIVLLGVLLGSYPVHNGERIHRDWRSQFKRQGISLGDWVKLARRGAAHASRDSVSFGGLADSLDETSGLSQVLSTFIAWRDDRAHGSMPRTRSDYIASNIKLGELLERLLDELQPLTRIKWWVVDDLDWDQQKKQYPAFIRALVGDHPEMIPTRVRIDRPTTKYEIMTSTSGLDISLSGLLRIMPCPECGADEFFYPDKLVDGQVRYRSIERGHKMFGEIHESPRALRREFEEEL